MHAARLPTPEAFADLAGMLVGKRVRAKKVAAPAPTALAASATYVDGSGNVAFVALGDLALVASMGAALAMVPPAVVQEAIKSGKPSEMLVDNAYEGRDGARRTAKELVIRSLTVLDWADANDAGAQTRAA